MNVLMVRSETKAQSAASGSPRSRAAGSALHLAGPA